MRHVAVPPHLSVVPDPRTGEPPLPLHALAAVLGAELYLDRWLHLAFPGATDITFPELSAIMTARLLNNVGDPWDPGHGRDHTKPYEQAVLRQLGELFGGDPGRMWGYVTSGASEGTLHALHEAVTSHSDAVVYASTSCHYSVAKAAGLLRATLVQIRTGVDGRMSLDDLREQLLLFRDRPAVIVATVGTTELEAVDDVAGIAGLCDDLGITRRRIHVDAALAGVPLALLPETSGRPPFDFRAGATSIVISGHKFLGTLMPCAVILYPQRPETQNTDGIAYIGASDTTISGSRSGHTSLLLYWSLQGHGLEGHRRRADASRALAAYTFDRLQTLGWRATWRPPAFTINLAQPAGPLRQPWVLGGDRRGGRIICMPGVQQDQIDDFLSDLAASIRGRTVLPRRPRPVEEATP